MGLTTRLARAASALVGGQAVHPIEAVGAIADDLFTSDDERLTHAEMRARIAQRPQMIQAHIDRIEAGHRSLFVAGWRPAIGWICAGGLAVAGILNPLLAALPHVHPVAIDTPELTRLLYALLGLGGYRTLEKLLGRAK